MIINHHPAFSWYSLLFFAALVIGFVLWARQKSAAESTGGRGKPAGASENEYKWGVTLFRGIPFEIEYYEAAERGMLFGDFDRCFPYMVAAGAGYFRCVLETLPESGCFLVATTPKPVTLASGWPSEAEERVVRQGDVFSVEYASFFEEEEEPRVRYSEIDESGVLDQPRRHAFLAYWASEVCPHEETYYQCQCVILVPKAEEASDKSPIVLVVELPR